MSSPVVDASMFRNINKWSVAIDFLILPRPIMIVHP
jgi:hypothetical protein